MGGGGGVHPTVRHMVGWGRVQRRERKGRRKWGAEDGEEGKEEMGWELVW